MTATDENGEFTLKGINENGVLVFTSVNMETLEVKVNGRNDFVVALKTKTTALEDVAVTVNTRYQKVSKELFVGSFAQLDSTDFHRRVGMGIIERLDGTVPGVVFDKKGFNFLIQIRGINTLGIQNTNTSPLFIIDNFVVQDSRDLLNLNPNDVESVTVLKDAAALSIWGARGGNGVIVVTTKRGKYNQRFHLSVSSAIGPLTPARDCGRLSSGRIWLSVNGVMKQDADLKDMVWSVPEIIAGLSRSWALRPGDLVFTGTPAGVGPLVSGDLVACGVEGLRELSFSIGSR